MGSEGERNAISFRMDGVGGEREMLLVSGWTVVVGEREMLLVSGGTWVVGGGGGEKCY